ncbi:MAG: PTS sugar transporter subunit IIA [Myxococcota bacterium]
MRTKAQALTRLADLLEHPEAAAVRIRDVLDAREREQSTGIGGGVAVPHGEVAELSQPVGAFLVCREPVAFDAIDGEPVTIFFALVGPKRASAQHLKLLARASRLLRNAAFRSELATAESAPDAYRLIAAQEEGRP